MGARLFPLLIFLLFGVACNTGPNFTLFKLPSGKDIKVTGIMRLHSLNSDPALVLNYLTDIPIDDHEALRKEVDEIWTVFRKDVENGGLNGGIIRATHIEGGGFIKHGNTYGFVFRKREDGNWHCLDDDKSEK
jgi:hypothetical protein